MLDDRTVYRDRRARQKRTLSSTESSTKVHTSWSRLKHLDHVFKLGIVGSRHPVGLSWLAQSCKCSPVAMAVVVAVCVFVCVCIKVRSLVS
jgi:hypothetical protein